MLVDKSDFEYVRNLLADGFDTFMVELMKTADELHELLDAMLDTELHHERVNDVLIKAHGLKSVGRQCGLVRLSTLARDMESTANENVKDMSTFSAEVWQRMREDYNNTLSETRTALSEITGS